MLEKVNPLENMKQRTLDADDTKGGGLPKENNSENLLRNPNELASRNLALPTSKDSVNPERQKIVQGRIDQLKKETEDIFAKKGDEENPEIQQQVMRLISENITYPDLIKKVENFSPKEKELLSRILAVFPINTEEILSRNMRLFRNNENSDTKLPTSQDSHEEDLAHVAFIEEQKRIVKEITDEINSGGSRNFPSKTSGKLHEILYSAFSKALTDAQESHNGERYQTLTRRRTGALGFFQ